MLMDIIMESLISMDEDTLDSVLESCSAEEIDIINVILEAVSEKDKAILSRGYKEDINPNENEKVDRFFDGQRLKNMAGDIKVDVTRIKNNLKGNREEVSDILDNASRRNYNNRVNPKYDDEIAEHRKKGELELPRAIRKFNYMKSKTKEINSDSVRPALKKYRSAILSGTHDDINTTKNNVKHLLHEASMRKDKVRGLESDVDEARQIVNGRDSYTAEIEKDRSQKLKEYDEKHSARKFNDNSMSAKVGAGIGKVKSAYQKLTSKDKAKV